MSGFTERDLKALMECIRVVYSDLNHISLLDTVLSAVSGLIPCGFSSFSKISHEDGEVRSAEAQSVNRWSRLEAFNAHIHEHPFINILSSGKLKPHPYMEEVGKAFLKRLSDFSRSPENMAVKISDVLTDAQFRSLAVYNDFFRLNSIEYQMGLPLVVRADSHTALTLNRDKKDFTEKERLLLGLLGPHIIQAYKNASALNELEKAFESGKKGIIVVNGLRVRFMSGNAHRILKGLDTSYGKDLPESVEVWLASPDGASGGASALQPLAIELEDRRITVRHMGFKMGDAVLLVSEEAVARDPGILESLGLTSREAEVLFWIAQGKSNRTISEILGIAPNTVKKHLDRVFEKLGVDNRTAAAKLAIEALG